MNKKIEFEYDGKNYTLEYDRKSIKYMEANGFSIMEAQKKIISSIDIMWEGAFYKNHKNEKKSHIEEMYKYLENKEELNDALMEMIRETYEFEASGGNVDDSKKVEWKMA